MAQFASLLLLLILIIAASRSDAFSAKSHHRDELPIINSHRQVSSNSAQITSSSAPITDDASSFVVSMPSRRAAVAAAVSVILVSHPSSIVSASVPEETTYVRGKVALPSGLSVDETVVGPDAALYVTARPNRPDNVPRAILDGSRGKPPPVLSARFSNPKFPFDFALTSLNFTPEGASTVEGMSDNDVWWSGEDLIVSARLDSDGVAATRDPTDLVGRGIYSTAAVAASPVSIELQGRGIFGKSVTARK
mmetsp:Transcript_16356/g.39144  ORF Transcript_16356/g.39144 Transcript_16356/m.39144 type:complete len:250 (+) Transcript_16356:43-792(+)